MSEQSILYALEEGVARITLNRRTASTASTPKCTCNCAPRCSAPAKKPAPCCSPVPAAASAPGRIFRTTSVAADAAPPTSAPRSIATKPLILQIKESPLPCGLCRQLASPPVPASASRWPATWSSRRAPHRSSSLQQDRVDSRLRRHLVPAALIGNARAMALALTGETAGPAAAEWG